jgi:hypothetical protein
MAREQEVVFLSKPVQGQKVDRGVVDDVARVAGFFGRTA